MRTPSLRHHRYHIRTVFTSMREGYSPSMAPLIRLSLSGTGSVQILADIETIDMEAITNQISESNKLGHHKPGKVVKFYPAHLNGRLLFTEKGIGTRSIYCRNSDKF